MALVLVLVNGSPFSGWKTVEVDQAFDKATGEAKVKMSELGGVPLPMKVGDLAQVMIDARSVIKGHVREIDGTLGVDSHDINATFRDQTQDLIQSTVGPKHKMKPPISLKQMSEKTLSTMGLSKIKVIDNVNPEMFQQGEQITSDVDDRGFSFLERWAQKRQCLLNTDGNGNLCIDRNRKRRGAGMLFSSFEDNPLNNVLESKYRNSDLDRHGSTSVSGQKSTNDKDWWESKDKGEATAQANPTQKNWGVAKDSSVRSELKLHARGVKGLSGSSPKKAAKWRSNVAKARGFQYTATVQGFYGGLGWLWWPGFIIPVVDHHWEIEAELLITNVKFTKTVDGGEKTEVTCTYPDAFTADGDGSSAASGRTSKFGMGGTGPGAFDDADPGLE